MEVIVDTHRCGRRLADVVNSKPLYVAEASEAYSSSIDPLARKPIHRYTPSVIRAAVKGGV